jgi:hypothetical protein
VSEPNMPTENEIKDAEVAYLLDTRDAACRWLQAIERRLEHLGHPVSRPKVKPVAKSSVLRPEPDRCPTANA